MAWTTLSASRRSIGAACLTLLIFVASACSYMQWKGQRKALRRGLEHRPGDLVLQKKYAPEDCFGVTGKVSLPTGVELEFLVAAFDHTSSGRELVGTHEVDTATGDFVVLLPPGSYDVMLFADLNRDGYFDTDEVVARTSADSPVLVADSQASDGVHIPGPTLVIDTQRPQRAEVAVRIKVVANPFVVDSVDDAIFSPELGQLGVYQPIRFLARTQRWVFSVGEPDFRKAQVVLVHGINGTPRDFRALIAGLDRSRYHVWLFYYPSGLPLDKLGIILSGVVENIAVYSDVPPAKLSMAVVAHSLGGLVARRSINEICRKGKPPYLRVYASFDTPYGGVESASRAVRRGSELIPSWHDVATGSDFLQRLHSVPLPPDLPFELFFGWGKGNTYGPAPSGDGTISLSSQLDPRAQAAATEMEGFEETHAGVLENPEAVRALSKVLDHWMVHSTTSAATHKDE